MTNALPAAGKGRSGPVPFKNGDPAGVVRWKPTKDGWQPELVEGVFRRRTGDTVVLAVGGTDHNFPRSEWEVCGR